MALDRVLAEDVVSPIAVPGHDNSAMDGWAVRFADLDPAGETTLRRIGASFAGTPYTGTLEPKTAVRIFTGGVMPGGADTVVMQERATEADGHVRIAAGAVAQAGQNRRFAGEDVKVGALVFARGQPVRPAELGMLASLGIIEVTVFRKLRVAFFSTGDELRSIGTPLAHGQIYDSNRYTLYGLLTRLGCEVVRHGRGPRRARGPRARVRRGGRECGRRHHVGRRVGRRGGLRARAARQAGRGAVLEDRDEAGPAACLRPHRRRALLRPAGQSGGGDDDVLPVRPRRAAGAAGPPRRRAPAAVQGALSAPIRKTPGRTEFQRGILARDADGGYTVRTTGDQGSGILSSMSQANCFIVLSTDTGNVAAGEMVDVQLLEGLL